MNTKRAVLAAWTTIFAAATAHADEARVELTLAPEQVRRSADAGFDRIDLVSTSHPVDHVAAPGQPDLPSLRLRVALPPGARPRAPRLEVAGRAALPGAFCPTPGEPARPLRDPAAPFLPDTTARTSPDPAIYGSQDTYPGAPARLAGTGSLGGVPVALVDVVPFELVPRTGALTLLTRCTLVLPYDAAATASAPAAAAPAALRSLVANSAQVEALAVAAPAEPEAALVILTDDFAWDGAERGPWSRGRYLGPVAAAFEALAADHTALGTTARVVRVSDVVAGTYGDYTRNAAGLAARDLSEVLRNFVQGCAWPRWGTRYLLLGGDVHVVPTRHVLDGTMSWNSTSDDWTASDPWDVLSAICRSWWPGATASARSFPSVAGVERLIDGDFATGWTPLPAGPAQDVAGPRAAAEATTEPAARRTAGGSVPVCPPVAVELDFAWSTPIWPAYNRLRLTWDGTTPPAKPVTVLAARDGGAWRSLGAWPAGETDLALGRGDWLELAGATTLRVRLEFPQGWPQGRRLMEVGMFGASNTAYLLAPDARVLVGSGLRTHEPVLLRTASGPVPDLVRYGASGGTGSWCYVASPTSTAPVRGATPYVLVRAPQAWIEHASHWMKAVTPGWYAADAYFGDVAGDEYVGGASFDAADPWHDFDRNDDGWAARDGDGIDSVFEVGVGRAPIDDAAGAERYARRARTYLRYRDVLSGATLDGFAGRGLLGAKSLWSANPNDEGYTSRALMASVWQTQDPGVSAERYFEHDQFFVGVGPLSQLVPAFDRGFNRVAILSHSGPTYACEFTPENTLATRNAPSYGVVFTYGCSPNAFDLLDVDSVSEAFLNAPQGGACAFVGNSRYGWGGDFVIEEGFWRAASATPRLGDMLHARELRSLDAPWLRVNLLGDPALPLWTHEPLPLFCQATRGRAGRTTVRVTSMRGLPVEGATVTLTARGALAARGRTDAQGRVTLVAPSGATLGVSAVSTPDHPDRAYLPVIRPLAEVVVAVEQEPAASRAE